MSEFKEIFLETLIIFAKNFSNALLQSVSEISSLKKANSYPSIIKSNLVENPKIETLKIGDHVMIEARNKRYWGSITSIDGEKIELQNRVLKRSWVVSPDQILLLEPD